MKTIKRVRNTLISVLLIPISFIDWIIYNLGYRSSIGYKFFRKTFAYSNGFFNDLLSVFLKLKGKFSKTELDELFDFPVDLLEEREKFLLSMKKNGYYIFDAALESKDADKIQNSIERLSLYKRDANSRKQILVDDISKVGVLPRYDYTLKDLVNTDQVLELGLSRQFLTLAQEYLGTKPILDLIASWWSYPTSDEKLKSRAAQMFHFDMDRIKFIKFFIYLTDVNMDNGPHVYVSSSHKSLPIDFQKDGRYSDETVSKAFSIQEIKYITGSRGKIMAVDTRGLHKGEPLKMGNRLILQFEYSNSGYGQNYEKSDYSGGLKLNKTMNKIVSCLIR